mmetsp:Transcript_127147/g.354044  ORF Transcript_127147/g.354044 Transcript_127147/m.354044 type:complete len:143 (+) Transcript_127147:87-515(+)
MQTFKCEASTSYTSVDCGEWDEHTDVTKYELTCAMPLKNGDQCKVIRYFDHFESLDATGVLQANDVGGFDVLVQDPLGGKITISSDGGEIVAPVKQDHERRDTEYNPRQMKATATACGPMDGQDGGTEQNAHRAVLPDDQNS